MTSKFSDIEEFRNFIKTTLIEKRKGMQDEINKISDSENLLGSGIIDSFLFIDLCLSIEDFCGIMIDVAEIDFENFTINDLYNYLSKHDA